MNDKRRKQIGKIIDELERLKTSAELIKEDEQEAFDSLPEQFQAGLRGEASERAIDSLESALDELEECISYLREVQ